MLCEIALTVTLTHNGVGIEDLCISEAHSGQIFKVDLVNDT